MKQQMCAESNLSNKLRNVYFRVIQTTLTVTCFDCTIVTGCDATDQHFFVGILERKKGSIAMSNDPMLFNAIVEIVSEST